VIDFLLQFDIFSLCETFVDNDTLEYSAFKDYDMYVSKATVLSLRCRKSGGVIAFVKKYLKALVERVFVKYDHMVVLKIDVFVWFG
jgi:hypothetical protein